MEGEYVGTVPLCTGSREDKQRRHGFGPSRVVEERCTRLASGLGILRTQAIRESQDGREKLGPGTRH